MALAEGLALSMTILVILAAPGDGARTRISSRRYNMGTSGLVTDAYAIRAALASAIILSASSGNK